MKSMKRSSVLSLIACVLLVFFMRSLHAQDFASNKTSRFTHDFSIDTSFVGKNMRDNKMEIDLSEMALKRSTNARVQKVAQRMVTDHTQILNDLSKIAQNNNMLALPGYPTDGVASGTASDTNNTTSVDAASRLNGTQLGSNKGSNNTGSTNTGSYNNLGTTGTTTAAGSNAANGLKLSGHNQMLLSSGNKDDYMKMPAAAAMQTASGSAFDKLWISQMLSMHEAKLAELTSAVNTINDSDLKTAVSAAIPKIKMHIDMLSALNSSEPRR